MIYTLKLALIPFCLVIIGLSFMISSAFIKNPDKSLRYCKIGLLLVIITFCIIPACCTIDMFTNPYL